MGLKTALPESNLVRAIHFGFERTSEQDPKYPIRLLVDIAIKGAVAGNQRSDYGSPGYRPDRGFVASAGRAGGTVSPGAASPSDA